MSSLKYIFFVFFFLIATIPHSYAEVSIAVLDVQHILTRAKASQSIQKQSETYRDEFLEEISKKEKELREEERALIEERNSIEQEKFLERKQAFVKKFIETQELAKQRKGDIDKAYAKAMKTLMDNIYEVVQTIADEENYTLVLSKQNVVVGEQSLDITKASLEALDKKISDIKLDVSSQ